MDNIKVGASILAANFANLSEDIEKVEKAGIDFLHIDVMDGHFVNNITIGPCVMNSIKKTTSLSQYAHLMIENPFKYIESFVEAGSDMLTFHLETVNEKDILGLINKIKSSECKVGIAINPDTSVEKVYPYLDKTDLILIMSVYPGFSGQKFITDVLPKIENLRSRYDKLIEIDGGVNIQTGKMAVQAGADVLVAASYIFKSDDINKSVNGLKNIKKGEDSDD